MQLQTNTGWRRLAPTEGRPAPSDRETTKEELFRVARLAVEALSLRPAARHVLDHIIGCFGGELIAGRYLVWPSNEFLMERTGLSERAVRYALRELLVNGILGAKDSANGKRFAIRSKAGQIVDAFGFDLGPLLERTREFTRKVEELKQERRQRRSAFDLITICRRQILEMLRFLDAEVSTSLLAEVERIGDLTPRRDSKMPVDGALNLWISLKDHVEQIYNAACGGKDRRHIEDNNDAPDQSCSNGFRNNGGRAVEFRISDLYDACPDALSYAGEGSDLLAAAASLRGGFGVHQSAWSEAVDTFGRAAAPVFFVALQIYENDQRAKATIKNFGGYFRAMVRKIATGELQLAHEIATLKYRRRN